MLRCALTPERFNRQLHSFRNSSSSINMVCSSLDIGTCDRLEDPTLKFFSRDPRINYSNIRWLLQNMPGINF